MSDTHRVGLSIWQVLVFQLKSKLLIIKRLSLNLFTDIKAFPKAQQLKEQPIISISQSELWNADDNEANWILTIGKIENLRIAAKRLNGIEVQANSIFSFWQHLGYSGASRGFVLGREIREGCVVPTIAGGICQLSNALYDAALNANFKIIERHQHSKIVKGSLAERGRDATVKWNYIDLRFKSDYPFRIEVELTEDKLIVKFRGDFKRAAAGKENSRSFLPFSKLNYCYSCGNVHCVKHVGTNASSQSQNSQKTFILDEKWMEFDGYVQDVSTERDIFILPFPNNRMQPKRFSWTGVNSGKIKSFWRPALYRAVYARLRFNDTQNFFAQMLEFDKKIAASIVRKIPYTTNHLVVSQNLLPFLWEQGVFGGRTFDVIMTRLPFENLHNRLDQALENFPESKTLNDFRASQTLIDFENAALKRARHIVTPHKEIADLFDDKAAKLNWHLPKKEPSGHISNNYKILFPGSALARKGAYEIKRLAQELDLCVVFAGRSVECDHFFDGIKAEFSGKDPFDQIKMIVYPAYVEHQPRLLLQALSKGIPVITTTASGLLPSENLTIVPIGNYEILKSTVESVLESEIAHQSIQP